MWNENRVRVRARVGVRVWVVARAWFGVKVGILLCSSIVQNSAMSNNFTHCASCTCRMGMALRLGLGSVVRFSVRVRVSLRV